MLTFSLAILMVLFSSVLPEIVVREFARLPVPGWLPYLKVAVLLILAVALHQGGTAHRAMSRFAIVLAGFVALHEAMAMVLRSDWWRALFADSNWFVGSVGSQISLKLIATIPMAVLLLAIYRSPDRVYLTPGNLGVTAQPIKAFGIKPNWVSWGRLALISGVLIASGTLLLTLLTVTGFRAPANLAGLPGALPLILVLALANSFSEGIKFRNTIFGSLTGALPKDQLILVAAVFFGIPHYYGAPQGVIGVIMSGVLGWYMGRSMYETGGFVAPWIIHFFQDVVILATMIALTAV